MTKLTRAAAGEPLTSKKPRCRRVRWSGWFGPHLVAGTGSGQRRHLGPKRDQFKSKAEIVSYVKKAFADGAAVIQAKGDKGMSELVVEPFSHQQVRIGDLAYGFIEHSGEHYGQLVVYYRLSGLVPPESRPKK